MIKKWKSLIQINWIKGAVGLLLALAVVLFPSEDLSTKKRLLLGIVCAATGFAVFPISNERWKTALSLVLGALCLLMTCVAPFVFLRLISVEYTYETIQQGLWEKLPFNAACVLMVCLLFAVISGRLRGSFTAGNLVFLILSIVDAAVHQFRGKELMFVDLYSIRTAANVARQYTPEITDLMFFTWVLWMLLFLLFHAIPGTNTKSRKKLRLKALAAEAVLVLLMAVGTRDMVTWTWNTDGAEIHGFYLNFLLSIRDSFVAKPGGYSPGEVARLEEAYPGEETAPEKQPNILVIMNESFADLSAIGGGPKTNQPLTPVLDSLTENTIRGNAVVSVFGGNTANSEFEFLTGHSMAFLPEGTVPYQFYLKEEVFSLPRLMSSLGYDTLATHPFRASGWSRTTAYPLLGFDGYTFEEAYPGQDRVREFISDREMYDYVLETLERQGETPLFLFGITMQNHGGYAYTGENFEKTISLEGCSRGYPQAEQYLSLINQSDAALGYLLQELEAYPEDTVVLFFGDHLPKLEDGFYEELYGGGLDTLDAQMLRYTVPFVVWANYDIPEQEVACTSLNYLGIYLLEAAGIQLPPYYKFLKEMETAVPSVTALGYYSQARQTYVPLDEAEGEEARWLREYAYLQYNNLFDAANRNESFFEKYLIHGERDKK